MQFTYQGYAALIERLRGHSYQFANYFDWQNYSKCVILRHDIDTSIDKAVELAKYENMVKNGNGGVKSTYYVLLTSNFYNVFSADNLCKLKQIVSYGHTLGLHFDEMAYKDEVGDPLAIREKIEKECSVLTDALDLPIKTFSFHRPSKEILDAQIEIEGLVNSYASTFFKDFKYLSDSRRRWREPVDEIIESEQYPRLHILTHAFWYQQREEDIGQTISNFVNAAGSQRYAALKENITDLSSIMEESEVR